eukprot:9491262-Pyramimonas_sp.AAC.2
MAGSRARRLPLALRPTSPFPSLLAIGLSANLSCQGTPRSPPVGGGVASTQEKHELVLFRAGGMMSAGPLQAPLLLKKRVLIASTPAAPTPCGHVRPHAPPPSRPS